MAADAIEHVSRHRLNGAELQVIADATTGIDELIKAEKKVVRGFLMHGGWPHRRVNLFVFENLRPVVERLRHATPHVAAQELEQKPMVHIYNPSDLTECSVFVNRSLMARHRMWNDPLAIEGLLAHEHAHPIAENSATRAARDLNVRITAIDAAPAIRQAAARSLEHLAHELCLHAPHEVFTNELCIRAGFGSALKHLNLMSLAEGRAGMAERARLAGGLQVKVIQGRLSETDMGLLLLAASLEAHVRMALETAAFARAGCKAEADAIEAEAETEVFQRVEPEIGVLYHVFYHRCLELTPYMDREAVRDWAGAAFAPVIEEFARRGARFGAEFYYGKARS